MYRRMTYITFLLIVLAPAIAVLVWLAYRMRRAIAVGKGVRAVLCVAVIALVYTTPWDNYLIYQGVWWYGSDRVLGTIGYVPVEEYGFMVLQAVMTGLLTIVLFGGKNGSDGDAKRFRYALGLVLWLATAVGGLGMLAAGEERLLYLGLITAWAGPVLAGTWWLGGRRYVAGGWRYGLACGLPTVYLWLWDAFALADGIWSIAPRYTVGLQVGTLPLEEAVFFLVTNVVVVQGVLLFWKGR